MHQSDELGITGIFDEIAAAVIFAHHELT
jgi:hypothetical protein